MGMKILWCDRNYDYVESFIAATKTLLPDVEFILKDEPVDAIKEILSNKNDYKLIISGQVFKSMTGTDLFEILFNNKVKIPFLLLTAQADYTQFSSYDLWYSFSYMDKFKADFYEVAEKVKELSHRDIEHAYSLHEKIKLFRQVIGFSIKEMATFLKVSESDVLNNEADYKKVTFTYISNFAQKFGVNESTLINSSPDYIQEMAQSLLKTNSHLIKRA